jgi:hypothetical protein
LIFYYLPSLQRQPRLPKRFCSFIPTRLRNNVNTTF